MATGTVKWFNNAKGYGFVLSEDKGEDLFIHYSSIQMDGYKSLKAGQIVEYDVQEGPKGLHAVNIRSASESASASASEGTEPTIDSADSADSAAVEDNLHLNPMHGLPESSKPGASSNRPESASIETAKTAEAEVAVD